MKKIGNICRLGLRQSEPSPNKPSVKRDVQLYVCLIGTDLEAYHTLIIKKLTGHRSCPSSCVKRLHLGSLNNLDNELSIDEREFMHLYSTVRKPANKEKCIYSHHGLLPASILDT